jgi:hypothetical protein
MSTGKNCRWDEKNSCLRAKSAVFFAAAREKLMGEAKICRINHELRRPSCSPDGMIIDSLKREGGPYG